MLQNKTLLFFKERWWLAIRRRFMMRKRIIAIFLCIAIVLTCISTITFAMNNDISAPQNIYSWEWKTKDERLLYDSFQMCWKMTYSEADEDNPLTKDLLLEMLPAGISAEIWLPKESEAVSQGSDSQGISSKTSFGTQGLSDSEGNEGIDKLTEEMKDGFAEENEEDEADFYQNERLSLKSEIFSEESKSDSVLTIPLESAVSEGLPNVSENEQEKEPPEITSVDLPVTWNLSSFPEEGSYTGQYMLRASLPSSYGLAEGVPPLEIVLLLEDFSVSNQISPYAGELEIPAEDPPYSDKITSGVSPKGTTIDLFDYWLTNQTDADNINPSWTIDKGINAEHALIFGNGMKTHNPLVGDWNHWTGNKNPRIGIVASKMENGYPKLNVDMTQAEDENFNNRNGEESLAYLFDPSKPHTGKESFPDVQGLLQVDKDGYYYFDSQQNYAVYYAENNSFVLYDHPGILPGGTSPVGQFFPFNKATANAETVWYTPLGGTSQQYTVMNRAKSNDSSINHYFGMHMSTRFIQQNGGYIDAAQSKPVTYEFSGDDDVWIFIDGMLVADLGGIHDKASVSIDFSTGDIKINEQTQNVKLGEILGYTSNTLPDDTYHTLDFFYLERGNVDSNLNLKYNLVTIPESSLIKVDQVGDPVPGAEFALYGYDQYIKDGTEAIPLATGTTDAKGEFIFLDENEFPITLDSLYQQYGGNGNDQESDLVLVETYIPPGYRSNGDIELYFYKSNEDEVLLLSNSVWNKGAYAMATVTATAPNVISEYGGSKQVTISGSGAEKSPLMFAVVFQKNEDKWLPVSGDPITGWNVARDSSWDSVLAAAKKNPYIFRLASSGAYQVEVFNLPGNIQKYYHIIKDESKSDYTVGYYYTSADSLDQVTEANTWRIDADPVPSSGRIPLERVFAMNLYMTNVKNRLLVQKTDITGKSLTGATFSLYKEEDVEIHADGTYTILSGRAPYDTVVTRDLSAEKGDIVTLKGGGIFPSQTKQILEKGKYYLIETVSPTDYEKNPFAIAVVVDDTGVYADAGAEKDGVTVTRGAGSIIRSVIQFAADDNVDATLHDIKAQLLTSDVYGEKWSDWDTTVSNTSNPEKELHLKYEISSEKKVLDYGPAPGWPSQKVGLETDVGWGRLEIRQCMNHNDTDILSPKQDLGFRDLTRLFSGTVTVRVENQYTQPKGGLKVTKTVVGETAPDPDKTFSFTVTLSGEGKNPNTGDPIPWDSINGTYGGMIFTNGVATFDLKRNESITASGLPAGLTYQVTEKNSEGYTAEWSGKTGTIQKNVLAEVKCINRKQEGQTGSVTIIKRQGSTTGEGIVSPLSGAGFTLYKKAVDGTLTQINEQQFTWLAKAVQFENSDSNYSSSTNQYTDNQGNEYIVHKSENGELFYYCPLTKEEIEAYINGTFIGTVEAIVEFTGLAPGQKYTIKETTVPAGYLPPGPLDELDEFTVPKTAEDGTEVYDVSYAVYNRYLEIGMTGWEDTISPALLGVLLTDLGGMLWVFTGKRKRFQWRNPNQ